MIANAWENTLAFNMDGGVQDVRIGKDDKMQESDVCGHWNGNANAASFMESDSMSLVRCAITIRIRCRKEAVVIRNLTTFGI